MQRTAEADVANLFAWMDSTERAARVAVPAAAAAPVAAGGHHADGQLILVRPGCWQFIYKRFLLNF